MKIYTLVKISVKNITAADKQKKWPQISRKSLRLQSTSRILSFNLQAGCLYINLKTTTNSYYFSFEKEEQRSGLQMLSPSNLQKKSNIQTPSALQRNSVCQSMGDY